MHHTLRRVTLFAVSTVFFSITHAQTLTGSIVDKDGKPVGYATVSLLSLQDSTFVSGTTTGDDGRFSLHTTLTEGLLRISCIGYDTLTTGFSSYNIGKLTLRQAAQQLHGVEVTMQRRLVKQDIDRIGYDVQADEESKTLTVLDLLRKVPLVTVDGEDNIKVNGQSSFRIHRNGHYDASLTKNAKEMLKAMPASAVKRIEVITEPGAREDAEGVNAILNIEMMSSKTMGGITGTVTTGYSTVGVPSANTFLTAQKGRFTTSLNYGWNMMNDRLTWNRHITDYTYLTSGNRSHSEGSGSNPGNVHWTNIDASYEIDSLNLLTFSIGGFFYYVDAAGTGFTQMTDTDANLLYSLHSAYTIDDYYNHSWNGRFDYEHRTQRKNERLTFSYMLNFTRSKMNQHTTYDDLVNAPMDYTTMDNDKKERFTEHTFQLDWVRPLGKEHKIEVGGKYIYRRNSSRNVSAYDAAKADILLFTHTTQVGAAYFDYMYSHKKWSARAGLRYEWSRMKGHYDSAGQTPFGTHLHDYVPQLSVKYQIDDAQSVKLSFTTSISRPGIGYLNPAVVADPVSVNFGNDRLRSATHYNIGLNYMLVKPKLTLTLRPYYSWGNRSIVPMEYIDDDIRYSTYSNAGHNRLLAVNTYVQYKPWKQTTLMTQWTLLHHTKEVRSQQLHLSSIGITYWASIQQELFWKLRLTTSISGRAGHELNDVYSYDPHYLRYNFSLQRSFLKDNRMTVRLGAYCPFDTRTTYNCRYVRGDRQGYGHYLQHGRRFFVSITYRFGKLKAQVKKAETTITNDDVVGGIKKQ